MIAESHTPRALERATSPLVRAYAESSTTPKRRVEVLDAETTEERYYSLRDRSQVLVDQGRLDAALEVLREALQVAVELDDESLVAMAKCNVAALSISLGNTSEHIADLRAVLMKNFSAETSYRAAYNLSHAYELQKEFKKALFYAQIARERALAAEDHLYVAKSLNQIGNGLVGESYFLKAVRRYQEALRLMDRGLNNLTVPPRISCSYCLIVLGQVHEGMMQLFRSLRWMKRHRALPVYQAWAHLFLCCGYLELGRFRRAWLHGMKARSLADQTGDYGAIKSSLFMLGEVERSAGDSAASYQWFAEMQRRFFPDSPEMPELMSQIGMTRVVNLRA
ncbi:MAG: hypothetical protein MPN21_05485 [Thermoanaerobaculia bacterium]|nr:hypothetical protein [Thermoanaerobaculia bacterium]